MTQSQHDNIIKDIERIIPILARNNGVYNDEIETVIKEYLSK